MSEETPAPEETPADAAPTGDVTKEEVMEILMEVYDPDETWNLVEQ